MEFSEHVAICSGYNIFVVEWEDKKWNLCLCCRALRPRVMGQISKQAMLCANIVSGQKCNAAKDYTRCWSVTAAWMSIIRLIECWRRRYTRRLTHSRPLPWLRSLSMTLAFVATATAAMAAANTKAQWLISFMLKACTNSASCQTKGKFDLTASASFGAWYTVVVVTIGERPFSTN